MMLDAGDINVQHWTGSVQHFQCGFWLVLLVEECVGILFIIYCMIDVLGVVLARFELIFGV